MWGQQGEEALGDGEAELENHRGARGPWWASREIGSQWRLWQSNRGAGLLSVFPSIDQRLSTGGDLPHPGEFANI